MTQGSYPVKADAARSCPAELNGDAAISFDDFDHRAPARHLTLYQRKGVFSLPGGIDDVPPTPPDRKGRTIQGWTVSSANRFSNKLAAIDINTFDDHIAFAMTFTLGEMPQDPQEFQRLRANMHKRLRRIDGFAWLLDCGEYQARLQEEFDCIHSHYVVVFRKDSTFTHQNIFYFFEKMWIDVMSAYEPKFISQSVQIIYDPVGWLEYNDKHSSRGVAHYQRAKRMPGRLPPAWEYGTGRMWRRAGILPLILPQILRLGREADRLFRRVVKKYGIAAARLQQVAALKLKKPDEQRLKRLKTAYWYATRRLRVKKLSDDRRAGFGALLANYYRAKSAAIPLNFVDAAVPKLAAQFFGEAVISEAIRRHLSFASARAIVVESYRVIPPTATPSSFDSSISDEERDRRYRSKLDRALIRKLKAGLL